MARRILTGRIRDSANPSGRDAQVGQASAALLPCAADQVAAKPRIAAQLGTYEAHDAVRIDRSREGEWFAKQRREGIAAVVFAAGRCKPCAQEGDTVAADLDRIPHAYEEVDHDLPGLHSPGQLKLDWRIAEPSAGHRLRNPPYVVGHRDPTRDMLPGPPIWRNAVLPCGVGNGTECRGADCVSHGRVSIERAELRSRESCG